MTPPIPGARLHRVEVRHVTISDGVAIGVAYAVDERGSEIAIAVPVGLARDLRSALRLGAFPMIDVGRHHVLQGFPGWPA